MPHRPPRYLIFMVALIVIVTLPSVWAEKVEYHDIYLTENRVCKACRWEIVNERHVRLTNRDGHRIVVRNEELVGIDKHPFWRKAISKSLHGIGLPGPVIVPGAFEDGFDYTCKYCTP